MEFLAKDYGIIPGNEVAAQLSSLLHKMAESNEEKALTFEKGEYYLNTDNCDEKMLFITNTVGDDEFSDGATPHLNKIGINLQNIKNLTINGNGATFIIDGKATNMAIEHCSDITMNDIEIKVVNPDMHELTVEKTSLFSVTFRLDDVSTYEPYKDRFAFTGKDYTSDFYENRLVAFWCALIRKDEPDNIKRVRHPFATALKITEESDRLFKVKYPSASRFKVGDRYYIYKARRRYAGIFVNSSKNISFSGIKQRFNYSLALVCQDSENISLERSDFSPEYSDKRLMASCADFIQICMCKGKINITDSNFCGAGDDMLNVHGVHFPVKDIDKNSLTLKFGHLQTHGYNPLHAGDKIEYVDHSTLLKKGEAVILSSELKDEQTIVITVDSTNGLALGDVIEDITMCPDLYFASNTLSRIITRNLLITTRGDVVIEKNKFMNSTMASILVSDDAKNWYESGPVRNMLIRDNYFGECHSHFIQVLPENGSNKQPVHSNITITGNTFDARCDKGLSFKCAENVKISDNVIKNSSVSRKFVKAINCKNFSSDI